MMLLLLTLLSPAGWAFAGEISAPYVVIFNPAAVSVPDDTIDADAAGAASFRFVAAPAALRAATMQTSAGKAISGGKTRVDAGRVESAIRAVAGRNRVQVYSMYANAVGGFAANLNAAQLAAVDA